jgi:hypothetical protein
MPRGSMHVQRMEPNRPCRCGFGGEGHLGRAPGGWPYHQPVLRPRVDSLPIFTLPRAQMTWGYRADDICRRTRCPKGGADVYLIRHNRGSLWGHELGWPWPKHGCFDDFQTSAARRRITDSWMSLHAPIACVVSETGGQVGAPGFVITLVCTNEKTRYVTASDVIRVRSLIGELGILSERDRSSSAAPR